VSADRWWRCPRCGNDRAGWGPGAGRIIDERRGSLRVTYRTPVLHHRLGARAAITFEEWRLTCPCGHAWTVTRET
jgi:hypothetical protein